MDETTMNCVLHVLRTWNDSPKVSEGFPIRAELLSSWPALYHAIDSLDESVSMDYKDDKGFVK